MEKITFHIISHTHWDREWYFPFETFRAELIDLIDSLLDILKQNKSFIFHLDGQTITLEDYLEIKPEKKEELKKYIKSGNILLGPWYVLSDEFLTSGEALIRNLMIGTRYAKDLGNSMLVGYLPDQFGHIAQLPQIFKGFNINSAIIGRGIQDGFAEHNWYSINGDCILAISLTHWYNNAQRLPDSNNKKKLHDYLERIYQAQFKSSLSKHVLLMNGCDHLFPQGNITEIIKVPNENNRWKIKQNNLPDATRVISSSESSKHYPIIFGELRSDNERKILAGTLSSRVYLKLQNYLCQTKLEKIIEPLIVFHEIRDKFIQKEKAIKRPSHLWHLIRHAWKILLQNQSHDSICGSSIDEVHKENEIRFLKVTQITEKVKEYLLSPLPNTYINNSYKKYLQVFNLTNFLRKEVIETELEFPLGPRTLHPDAEPELNKKEVNKIVLYQNNKQVDYKILKKYNDYKIVRTKDEVPLLQAVQKVKILLDIDIEPFSVNNYEIVTSESSEELNESQVQDTSEFKNNFYKLTVNKNGTISVILKEKNYVFNNLHRFSIEDDFGDAYHFTCGDKQNTFYSEDLEWQMNVIEENILRKKFKLTTYIEDNIGIETEIICFINSNRIDFKTIITSNYRNKRIRLHFPTNFCTNYIIADTPFGILRRSRPQVDWENYSTSQPLHNWIDHTNNSAGLAFFGGGLSEYELYEDGNGFAVTLIRAFGKLSSVKSLSLINTPDAQCNRVIIFNYALYPHEGNFEDAKIYASHLLHQSPLVINQSDEKIELKNMINTKPEIPISALKKSEDNENMYVIRLFNPLNKELENCEININLPLKNTYILDLNEKIIGKIGTNSVLKLKPFEIITLGIEV